MANFWFTNKAVKDVSKIWDYTYEAWSEKQADKYYELLIDFCKELSCNTALRKNYTEIDTKFPVVKLLTTLFSIE